ncbi:uncharacterized protein LOC131941243 [Physella acuta]|uniref:uncharacterized protein LOC131941243 n=1 Tax=Physella acuta TaxID=109671 RepID=UPI0027DC9C06|nr:uncharacterized protein LOC131941243 [Physella acuta]
MACIRYVAPKGDNKVRHFAGQLKNGSDVVLSARPTCGSVDSSTIHITTPTKTPACGGVDSHNLHITTPKKTASTGRPWDIFITSRTDQATAHLSTKDWVSDQQPAPDAHPELSQLAAHSTSGLNKTGNTTHHNRLSDDVIDLDEAKDVVQSITQRTGSRSSRCSNKQLSQGPYWRDNKPLPGGHKLLPGRGAIKRSISDMALEGRDQLSFFGYTGGVRSYGVRSYGVGDLDDDDDDDEWCIDLDQILEQVRSKSHAHRNVILTQMGGSQHELNTASPQNEVKHGGPLTSRSDSGVPLVSDRLRTRRFALADPERMIMRQEDRERIEQEVGRRRQSIVRRVSQFFNVQLGLNREEDLI